jgi:hypothetical protein
MGSIFLRTRRTEYEDFAQFTIFLPNTLTAVQFKEEVQKFCERVAERIATAPLCSIAMVISKHASETLAADEFSFIRYRGELGLNEIVLKPLMVSFAGIVLDIIANGLAERGSPIKMSRSRHSSLILRTNRFAIAFRLGERGGRRRH